VQQERPKVEHIAVPRIHHLDATYASMFRLIKANSHSWAAWKFILENLERVHLLVGVMFFQSAFGTKLDVC
jgi:hypothetical protein